MIQEQQHQVFRNRQRFACVAPERERMQSLVVAGILHQWDLQN